MPDYFAAFLDLRGRRCLVVGGGEIADEARAAGVASPAVLLTGPTIAGASVPLSVRRVLAGMGG